VLSDQRSACRQLTSSKLDWILEVEKVTTFTLNTHYLEDYKIKFEAKYKILRHEKTEYGNVIRILTDANKPEDVTPVEDDNDDGQWPTPSRRNRKIRRPTFHSESPFAAAGAMERDSILGALQGFGLPATVDNVLKMLPDEPAVSIMADVRAYWQVAFKRFADNVALAIDMDYVRGFGKGLETKLRRQLRVLGAGGEERCLEYFAQPRNIVAKREVLKAKSLRLEDAQGGLMTLLFDT